MLGALIAGFDVPGWVPLIRWGFTKFLVTASLRWIFTGTKSLVTVVNFLLYSTNGAVECAILCGNNDQCAGWTQHVSTNLCYLKTSMDHKNVDPEWIHGPPCSGLLTYVSNYLSRKECQSARVVGGKRTNITV